MENGTCKDLETLLRRDVEASRLYLSLPGYVQDQIKQRGGNINSYESLKDYAENLLRGDD